MFSPSFLHLETVLKSEEDKPYIKYRSISQLYNHDLQNKPENVDQWQLHFLRVELYFLVLTSFPKAKKIKIKGYIKFRNLNITALTACILQFFVKYDSGSKFIFDLGIGE